MYFVSFLVVPVDHSWFFSNTFKHTDVVDLLNSARRAQKGIAIATRVDFRSTACCNKKRAHSRKVGWKLFFVGFPLLRPLWIHDTWKKHEKTGKNIESQEAKRMPRKQRKAFVRILEGKDSESQRKAIMAMQWPIFQHASSTLFLLPFGTAKLRDVSKSSCTGHGVRLTCSWHENSRL